MRCGLQGPYETIVHGLRGRHPRHRQRRPADRLGPLRRRRHRRHRGGRRRSPALAGFGNMTALSTTRRQPAVRRRPRRLRDGRGRRRARARGVGARRRPAGATILGEVLGAASNADAHHITAPSPGGVGAVACMRLALDDAGLAPGDIAQVNAHGTSTPLNDAAEAEAVARVFGDDGPPVTSIKGVTGHALGAAGALEAAAVLLSFEHRLIPPTANTKVVDLGIDVVTGDARAVGARPDDLQQLRLRRPQRLADPRPGLTRCCRPSDAGVGTPPRANTRSSGVDDDEQEVAAAGDGRRRRRARPDALAGAGGHPAERRPPASARRRARPGGGSGRRRGRRTAAACRRSARR